MARAGRAACRAAVVAAARGLKSNVVDFLTALRHPRRGLVEIEMGAKGLPAR